MPSPTASPRCSWNSISLILLIANVLFTDWQLGAAVASGAARRRLGDGAAGQIHAQDRQPGHGAKPATFRSALAEAMDGRRIIKAYGLEAHVTARVDARLTARLKTLLRTVRLRAAAAPTHRCVRRPGHGAGAVRGGLAESARSAQPQRLYRLPRRPAAGAAAGAQSQPISGRSPRPAWPPPAACSPSIDTRPTIMDRAGRQPP